MSFRKDMDPKQLQPVKIEPPLPEKRVPSSPADFSDAKGDEIKPMESPTMVEVLAELKAIRAVLEAHHANHPLANMSHHTDPATDLYLTTGHINPAQR